MQVARSEETLNYKGTGYHLPIVKLVAKTPVIISELATRICKNTFKKSPIASIANFEEEILKDIWYDNMPCNIKEDDSDLCLRVGAGTFGNEPHGSTLEFTDFTFYITGTSRGVLQELVRHRIASYEVMSSRMTLGPILGFFLLIMETEAAETDCYKMDMFSNTVIRHLNPSLLESYEMRKIEMDSIFRMLNIHYGSMSKEKFIDLILGENGLITFNKICKEAMEESMEKTTFEPSNNVANQIIEMSYRTTCGDPFKYIVKETFATKLMMKINLRSLMNFMRLRDAKPSYFLIQALAEEIRKTIPKYELYFDSKAREKYLKEKTTC